MTSAAPVTHKAAYSRRRRAPHGPRVSLSTPVKLHSTSPKGLRPGVPPNAAPALSAAHALLPPVSSPSPCGHHQAGAHEAEAGETHGAVVERSVISVPHPVAGRLVRDHHPGFLIHPKWAVEPVLCEKEVVAADGPRFSAVKSAADGNFVVHTPSPIHGGRFLCISRTISKRRALSLATIRSKMSKEFIAALPEAIVAAGAPAPPSTSGPASPPQGQAPRWGGLIDFTAAAAHVKVPMQLGPGAKGQVYHLETVSFTGRASSSPPPTSPRAVSGCMCIDVYLSSPLKETEEESVRITVKLPLVRYVAPAAQTPSPSSGPPAAVPEECIYALDLSLLTHAPFHHVRDTESLVVYYQQKSRPSRLCRKPRWYITFTEEEVQRWAAKGDQGTGALAPLELMEHIVVVSSSSNGEAERAPTRESGCKRLR